MRRFTVVLTVLSTVVLATIMGCHKDPLSSYEPDVVNAQDNFHFQLKDVKNHDTTLVYFWHMLGSSANIDQSASIKGGSVAVTVEDSAFQLVYQTDLRQNGSFTTTSGTPGWWRIRFVLTDFSGMIDFRALRR